MTHADLPRAARPASGLVLSGLAVLCSAVAGMRPAHALPPGTTTRGADAAQVGTAAPPPPAPAPGAGGSAVQGSEENLTVHGQRHFTALPSYNADVINRFENGTYRGTQGWLNTARARPGSGRDPNTDAQIGQFGTAYGASSPAPGANVSAPGAISPIQDGVQR